jgi:LmbE family N-acetylglucosaminyl deacetylase
MRSILVIAICALFNILISVRSVPETLFAKQTREGRLKADRKTPILLAIFAHPDDELLTGAALAHYASIGVKVFVAITTDGALGTTDFANIPAGPELVAVRHQEMICSAMALGIESPIFIGLADQMNMTSGGLPAQLDTLRYAVSSLFMKLKPDVVVTFGPEGWTGHPDHRLTGIIVTEVFASRQWPGNPKLYFSGLPNGSITETSWAKYLTVDSTYLSVRVPVQEADYLKLRAAFNCHQSQYRESVRQKLPLFLKRIQNGIAMFRPFSSDRPMRNSLFDENITGK